MKILIIDDEIFIFKIFSDVLKKAGYMVVGARTGKEGINKMKIEKPDLVLLDIVMPGIDGFEVLRQVKKDQTLKNIPIIILSALGQEEEIKKGIELGAEQYWTKTDYNLDKIVKMVGKRLQPQI